MKYYVSKLWTGPANENRSTGKAGDVSPAERPASTVSAGSPGDEGERAGDGGEREDAREDPLPRAMWQAGDEQLRQL